MRRGLISRATSDLPDAVLDARLARLRAAMSAEKLDALLIYTNNTRPAGVSWLTGFVPYWSEAMLVVTPTHAPVLVAALTARVKRWIEGTSRLGDIVHTPRIGHGAGRLIADAAATRVGVVELDHLAAGIVDDLRESAAVSTLEDASTLFAQVRGKADPSDIALCCRAATIANRALALADADSRDAGSVVAAVDGAARRLGAEEIYVALAPDLDRAQRMIRVEGDVPLGRRFALRASVAYRGVWVRTVRTFGQDDAAAIVDDVNARLADAVAQLPSARGFAGFGSWLVEGCRQTQPLEPLIGSRIVSPVAPMSGSLVSVQACIAIDGAPVLVGGPALIGADGQAASLLKVGC